MSLNSVRAFLVTLIAVAIVSSVGCSVYKAKKDLQKFNRLSTPELGLAIFKKDDEEYRNLCASGKSVCTPKLYIHFDNTGHRWAIRMLPSYVEVTDIHNKNVRKYLGNSTVLIEIGARLSRKCAQKVDYGEITQSQYKVAWELGLSDMAARLNREFSKLQQNMIIAEGEDAETWRSIERIAVAVVIVAVAAAISYEAQGGTYQQMRQYPGNCQYSWQFAKDGSICGDRAASRRPGGWEPAP